MLSILNLYLFSVCVFHPLKDSWNNCEQTDHVSEVVEVHGLVSDFLLLPLC